MVVLAGEFLNQAKEYIEERVHPSIIIKAFRTASRLVRVLFPCQFCCHGHHYCRLDRPFNNALLFLVLPHALLILGLLCLMKFLAIHFFFRLGCVSVVLSCF